MASNLTTQCTVVIFHRPDMKETLFEILKRMNCEVREISSLEDLLNSIQNSQYTFCQFAETPQENPYFFLTEPHENPQSNFPPSSGKKPPYDYGAPASPVPRRLSYTTLSEIEKIHIKNTLKECNWKVKTAAKLLGINRTTLYRKMHKYDITRE